LFVSTTPTTIARSWDGNACRFDQHAIDGRLVVAIVVAFVKVVIFVTDDDLQSVEARVRVQQQQQQHMIISGFFDFERV
jgi:hypothetical protein